jgi:hypothetical protein
MVKKKKVTKKLKHKTTVDGVKTDLHIKPVASLPRYQCKNPKCKHSWIPRINQPMVCPRCHRNFAG